MPRNSLSNMKAGIGDRIRKARIGAGLTQLEVANKLGINRVSVTQWETGVTRPVGDKLEKMARLLNVSADWLIMDEGLPPGSGLKESPPVYLNTLPVTGFVEAGKWFDIDGDGAVPDGMAVPVVGDRPVEWQRAFIVSGNSINKIAGPGDVLVCLDLIASGTEMQPDDLVIVERSRFGGQMVERTAKRLRKTATGWELWPESTDPAYQAPIVLNGADDHEEIKVTAKVLWAVRSV